MSGEARSWPRRVTTAELCSSDPPQPPALPTQPAPSTLMACSQRLNLPNLSLLVCRMGPHRVAVRTRGQGASEGPVPGCRPPASSCVGSHKGALRGPIRALTLCRDPTASHPPLGVRISAYASGAGGYSDEQLGTIPSPGDSHSQHDGSGKCRTEQGWGPAAWEAPSTLALLGCAHWAPTGPTAFSRGAHETSVVSAFANS